MTRERYYAVSCGELLKCGRADNAYHAAITACHVAASEDATMKLGLLFRVACDDGTRDDFSTKEITEVCREILAESNSRTFDERAIARTRYAEMGALPEQILSLYAAARDAEIKYYIWRQFGVAVIEEDMGCLCVRTSFEMDFIEDTEPNKCRTGACRAFVWLCREGGGTGYHVSESLLSEWQPSTETYLE
jgi:hypothetical protein